MPELRLVLVLFRCGLGSTPFPGCIPSGSLTSLLESPPAGETERWIFEASVIAFTQETAQTARVNPIAAIALGFRSYARQKLLDDERRCKIARSNESAGRELWM